mgnify:CR=1 FL=1
MVESTVDNQPGSEIEFPGQRRKKLTEADFITTDIDSFNVISKDL